MEYILSLERSRRFKLFYALIVVFFALTIAAFYIMGFFGLLMVAFLLFFLVLTPILHNKNYFFIILWLFIVPLGDAFNSFRIMGANPMTVLATLITVFVATIVFYRTLGEIWHKLPYVRYIILFMFILFLNCFRPGTSLSSLMDVFRYYIQIYIIYLVYVSFKENRNKIYFIFNYINLFVVCNSIVSILQKVTGFGLIVVGGVARAPGILVNPNVTAIVVNIYLPMAIYMLINSKNKKDKIHWGISILINTLSLLLTLTKVGYICFLAMLFMMFFCLPYRLKIKSFLIFTVSTVFLIAMNYILNLQIIENILIRFNEHSSYEWRILVWGLLIQGMNLGNIWFGHGIDTAYYYLTSFGQANMVHNVYLQLLFEYGLTSIIFYLSFISALYTFMKAFMDKSIQNRMDYIFPISILVQIFINMYVVCLDY